MRPGCYDPMARLEDMDRAGILASLCFPTITRFCGQLFMEASDREFGFVCLQDYNDWMIEEWCGAAPGRYIPLMLIPMWDPALAAKEMERMRGQGRDRVRLLREPRAARPAHDPRHRPLLGSGDGGGQRPRDGRVHARRLVVELPQIAPDAPFMANLTWGADPHRRARCSSWLFSGMFQRLPEPQDRPVRGRDRLDALLPRAGRAGARQAALLGRRTRTCTFMDHADTEVDLDTLDIRETFRDHVFGCFIQDDHGIASLDEIGEDNVMCETDYPHSDSTWPDCIEVAQGASPTSPRCAVQDPARQRRAALPVHPGRAAGAASLTRRRSIDVDRELCIGSGMCVVYAPAPSPRTTRPRPSSSTPRVTRSTRSASPSRPARRARCAS